MPETLGNELFDFAFDDATGRLVGIHNLVTGGKCLQAVPAGGNPFAVYTDFTGEFVVPVNPNRVLDQPLDPETFSMGLFAPSEGVRADFSRETRAGGEALTITYSRPNQPLVARVTVKVRSADPASRWSFSLTNTGAEPVTVMAVFPFLSGIHLGDEMTNLMVEANQAGYVRPLWAARGGVYGGGAQQSMQWGCVFDEEGCEALGFLIRDAALRNKQIAYRKPSIEVRYFPPEELTPGETLLLPEAELLVYVGDWKPTAVAYRRWFEAAVGPVRQPDWVRGMQAHLGQWFEKRGQEASDNFRSIQGLADPMESFEELPAVYRRLPVDTIEFAFFCRGSMGQSASGKVFTHTDGDNVIREDLGGPEALRRGIEATHRQGFHFTFYVDAHICPTDSDVALHGGGTDWAITNRDGTNQGNYSGTTNWLHMCPGAQGWQDHLAATAWRLLSETGADGLRLDSLGAYWLPCYNPLHNHRSPFDYNLWMDELLSKVAAAARRANPEAFLSTELPVDFYSRHFNGALTQQWGEEFVAVGRDVAPMRVAVPEYYVIPHNPCGPVAACLMGYPGGSGGNEPGGTFSELDEFWRAASFGFFDLLRWGEAAFENPVASRTDVTCRRFSSPEATLVVGARLAPRKPNLAPELVNLDIDGRRCPGGFSVTVGTGDKPPASAWLVDVLSGKTRRADYTSADGITEVEVDCNWFALVLLSEGAKPLSEIELPAAVRSGESLEVRLSLLGAPVGAETEGRLFAPVLGFQNAPVQLPDVIEATIPADTPPGKYPVELTSKTCFKSKRFLRVE